MKVLGAPVRLPAQDTLVFLEPIGTLLTLGSQGQAGSGRSLRAVPMGRSVLAWKCTSPLGDQSWIPYASQREVRRLPWASVSFFSNLVGSPVGRAGKPQRAFPVKQEVVSFLS